MSETENKQSENKPNFRKLKGLEVVRYRPGMYFGGNDSRAMLTAVYLTLEYSLEAASRGLCDHIEIALQDNNTFVVRDNGPGLSVNVNPVDSLSSLEILLTQSASRCGRFEWDFPIVLSWVNGGAAESKAQVRRDGYVWEQSYNEGVPTGPLAKVRTLEAYESTGNTLTFALDPTVFVEASEEISYVDLAARLRELAYFMPNLRISMRDERQTPAVEHDFYYPNGTKDFIAYLNRDCTVLHDVIRSSDEIELILHEKHRRYIVKVDFAVQFTDCDSFFQVNCVNFREANDGGVHIAMLRRGICDALRDIVADKELEVPESDVDLLRGLTAIVRVVHPDPQFASMKEVRLMNPDVRVIETSIYMAVESFFSQYANRDILECVLSRTSDRTLPEKERRYGEFAPNVKYDRVQW